MNHLTSSRLLFSSLSELKTKRLVLRNNRINNDNLISIRIATCALKLLKDYSTQIRRSRSELSKCSILYQKAFIAINIEWKC